MAGTQKRRLPYRVSLGGCMATSTAFLISLFLFWYGAESVKAPIMRAIAIEAVGPVASQTFWAVLSGASLMGGVFGAAIGQMFRDERGGAASMGAFIGALIGPPILLIFLFVLLLMIWLRLGCPSA